MNTRRSSLSTLAGLLAALALLLSLPGFGLAQESPPHPTHIHEGSCAELDPAPLYPLTDVAAPEATSGAGNGWSALPVEMSTTTVDAPFTDLTAGNLAINVHESADNVETYIACGDIAGPIVSGDAGDVLAVGLGQLNDSGYSGIAVLQASGEQTVVTIYLAQGLAGTGATPESSDMAGMDHGATPEATAETVEVDIVDFAYNPETITVKVGQSVTWTNQDSAPHTVTARDRDVLQSGTMNQGDTFTQTFDTPGTYEYFCEFHPNMSGTVVVEAP